MGPGRSIAKTAALMASSAVAVFLTTSPVGCGSSEPECPSGQTRCGGVCVDTQTSKTNCGSCGHDCGLGTCTAGACVCDTSPATVKDCGGSPVCVDTATDPKHCGTCNNACTTNHVCESSSCTCPSSLPTECSDTCVDTTSDKNHCGGCTTVCTTNHVCQSSSCGCPSSLPTDCSGTCVDTKTNTNYCGSCTTACTVGQSCTNSVCCGSASPNHVCGTLCCATGDGCCNSDTACQTEHDNGIENGKYYDCLPLGSYTVITASEAALSWNNSAAQSDQTSACGAACLGASTGTSCAVWCYAGTSQGRVHLNSIGSNCICPYPSDPTWQ